MRILISGASGFVGSRLSTQLEAAGHKVFSLTRKASSESAIEWNPSAGTLNVDDIEGFDVVVHLAGENVGAGRWTDAKKKRILDSRVQGTRLLVDSVLKTKTPPKAFISASAIGFYGSRGDERLNEQASKGTGFLSDVVQAWEGELKPLEAADMRVAKLRFGVVLDPSGGALAEMLMPFKMCVGGILGNGKQWMSWVSLDDTVGALKFAIENDSVSGVANVVAPEAATNYDFTKSLGKALGRPTIFPMPGFMVKLVFGQKGEELLLGSTRVQPEVLQAAGYQFKHPSLDGALQSMF